MNILETIHAMARQTRNSELAEAGQAGRRIMGYFCSYVPVEILHAAGFIPYKIRAVESTGTEKGDVYFAPLNCSFVRHLMDKAMKGDFAFLDGVVFMNGCDHAKRIFDNWRYADAAPGFRYMHFVPHVVGSNARAEYRASLKKLIQALEGRFQVAVTDEKLADSIRRYNELRRLLRTLDAKRRAPRPAIAGSEMLALVMAVTAVPVETAIALLEEVLVFVEGRSVAADDRLRMILLAGCSEEPGHIRLYEDAGVAVVADSICFGGKFYQAAVDETGDPLEALAAGYLRNTPSCPRMMDDFPRRLATVAEMARASAADAVVVEKLKFCDMWGWEIERLRRESRKGTLPPLLAIERELYGGATGQIRTRIQAFLEQIRGRQEIDRRIVRSSRTDYYVRQEV